MIIDIKFLENLNYLENVEFKEAYDEIITALKTSETIYDEKIILNAMKFAKFVYGDKLRFNKETIFYHSIGLAKEIINLRLDLNSVLASILHEVNVDSEEFKYIGVIFNTDIQEIIKGVYRVSYLNYTKTDKIDENILRKMFMAIAKDIRTVIIKLLDRLYNMRRVKEMPQEYAKIKAKECLEIYSPIAHRLGMSNVKSELEDISFKILYPDAYQDIKRKIEAKKKERQAFIDERISEINDALKANNIHAKVYGRPKHFYSIYKKMVDKHYDIEDIFDLLAIRIIVDDVKECYMALGLVHEMYKPMPR